MKVKFLPDLISTHNNSKRNAFVIYLLIFLLLYRPYEKLPGVYCARLLCSAVVELKS